MSIFCSKFLWDCFPSYFKCNHVWTQENISPQACFSINRYLYMVADVEGVFHRGPVTMDNNCYVINFESLGSESAYECAGGEWTMRLVDAIPDVTQENVLAKKQAKKIQFAPSWAVPRITFSFNSLLNRERTRASWDTSHEETQDMSAPRISCSQRPTISLSHRACRLQTHDVYTNLKTRFKGVWRPISTHM